MNERGHTQHKSFTGRLNDGALMVAPAEFGGFAVVQHTTGSLGVTQSRPLACFTNPHDAALWIEDALTRHEFGQEKAGE